MFEVGMRVKILPNAEYKGRYTNRIGVIKTKYSDDRLGVEFDDEKNHYSKEGVFWFKVKNVALVDTVSPQLNAVFSEFAAKFRFDCEMAQKRNQLPFPDVKRVIYNGPKTIILWADNTKTIVSCGEGETYDYYTGFCAAVVKKLFGSTSNAKKVLEKVIQIQ